VHDDALVAGLLLVGCGEQAGLVGATGAVLVEQCDDRVGRRVEPARFMAGKRGLGTEPLPT